MHVNGVFDLICEIKYYNTTLKSIIQSLNIIVGEIMFTILYKQTFIV